MQSATMRDMRSFGLKAGLAIALATAAIFTAPSGIGTVMAESQIRYVVNNLPVTSFDIQRRAAFLKLQRKSGNLNKTASDEMVEQALKQVEMARLNIRVTDQQVNEAFARFAKQNKLTTQQLDQVMAQAGVTSAHFKQFIRVQMGWSQALAARFRSTGRMSEQDAVRRMLKQGGEKPVATEYMLQQVIFVVPAAERGGKLATRKREAEAMRSRFRSCDTTRDFAKGLVDVTVRDLGRVLSPELPPDWADFIKAAKQGTATPVRETDRGVEFIGVCSSREVSDDRVAQMVFQNEGTDNEKADELSKKYIAELREKARITER